MKKYVINARKYVTGIIIGAVLMYSGQAFAATLFGSTVDAVIQVEVDGQSMGQAPVIDGVSYLPVRKFGTKAGYDVAFGEGKATLTSEATANPTAINQQAKDEQDAMDRENKISELKVKKTHIESRILEDEKMVTFNLNTIDKINKGVELEGKISEWDQESLDKAKAALVIVNKRIADAQAELADIEKQLTELEAQ